MGRVEDVLEDDERTAASLRRTWLYEYAQTLSDGETLRQMRLALQLHVGNPEAFDEWKALMVEEIEYLGVRADEWVSGLEPREQPRWRRLLAAPGVGGDEAGRPRSV